MAAREAPVMPGARSPSPRHLTGVLDRLEGWLLRWADAITAHARHAPPSSERLKAARIVAHRGIYDNIRIFENSLSAFDKVREAGIWGLECDVRWTRDGVAVVHHDPDGRRLHHFTRPIASMTLRELQPAAPLIPTLETVVQRYGKRLHLMIEVKAAPGIAPPEVDRSLAAVLASLVPGKDYHLMSLSLEVLAGIAAVPRRACLPIARLNPGAAARAAVAHAYGGMTGHYAFVHRGRIRALHRQGLRVGTGFVNSPGCLYREMARGVDWLFSDRALALQRLVVRPGAAR
jgi:glycerophosphoryl diester phosphodiesterase